MQWWDLTLDIARRATEDAADWHANAAETSPMLVLRPELVDTDRMRDADDPDRTHGTVFRYGVQKRTRLHSDHGDRPDEAIRVSEQVAVIAMRGLLQRPSEITRNRAAAA